MKTLTLFELLLAAAPLAWAQQFHVLAKIPAAKVPVSVKHNVVTQTVTVTTRPLVALSTTRTSTKVVPTTLTTFSGQPNIIYETTTVSNGLVKRAKIARTGTTSQSTASQPTTTTTTYTDVRPKTRTYTKQVIVNLTSTSTLYLKSILRTNWLTVTASQPTSSAAPAISTSSTTSNAVSSSTSSAVLSATTTSSPTSSTATSASNTANAASTSPPVYMPELANSTLFAQNILKEHNDFRALFGVGPLVWNTTLAQFAQSWVNRCGYYHSIAQYVKPPWYGENIAAVWARPASYLATFNSTSPMTWWGVDEFKKYSYNPRTDRNDETTGHFQNAVWKSYQTLGCAVAYCPNGLSGQNNSTVSTYDSLYWSCDFGITDFSIVSNWTVEYNIPYNISTVY